MVVYKTLFYFLLQNTHPSSPPSLTNPHRFWNHLLLLLWVSLVACAWPAGLSWRERETLRLHWLGLGIWSLARRFPRELGRSWWVVLVLVWAGASGEVRGAETSSFATIWLLSFSFFCTFCFNAAQTVEIWRLSPTPMKVVDWLGVSVILKNSLNT